MTDAERGLVEEIERLDTLYAKRNYPLPKAPRAKAGDNGDPCVCGARNTWHPECYVSNKEKFIFAITDAWPKLRLALSAARDEALEEAAKVCDDEANEYYANMKACELTGNMVGAKSDLHGQTACVLCAKAIRSRKAGG